MDYENFIDCVQQKVMMLAGDKKTVEVRRVLKNNGHTLDGITINGNTSCATPNIYLNGYYKQYAAGRDIDAIVNEIMQLYELHAGDIDFKAEDFCNYAYIKDRIVYKLIDYASNNELLSDIPYKRMLDLALVFYIFMDRKDGGTASILIHNSHMRLWNVDEAELYRCAAVNTPRLLTAGIIRMQEVLDMDWMDETAHPFTGFANRSMDDISSDFMFVLTNERGVYGAVSILYDGVLEDFAAHMESDIIIIPSSVHEVILVPVRDDYNTEELNELVQSVNESSVECEEVLSPHIYMYDRGAGVIVIPD